MIHKLNKIFKALLWRYRDLLFNLKLLTFFSLIKYYLFLILNKKYVTVFVKGINKNFLIRVNNRIDRNVLKYVFFQKYHLPPKEISFKKDMVILDLGSNIGCTLVDLKMRFPEAKIYGYEMHPENFQIAKKNCEGFHSICVNNMAVWINRGYISFNKRNHSDAFAIDEYIVDNEDKIRIPSIRIADIISDNNLPNIDYVKMDIEGAEIEIFDSPDLNWLDNVLSINIEFHNIPNSKLTYYMQLLQTHGFKVYKSPHHWLSILAYKNYS